MKCVLVIVVLLHLNANIYSQFIFDVEDMSIKKSYDLFNPRVQSQQHKPSEEFENQPKYSSSLNSLWSNLALEQLKNHLSNIDYHFSMMLTFKNVSSDESRVMDFAKSMVNCIQPNCVLNDLNAIFGILFKYENLIKYIEKITDEDIVCIHNTSPQQALFNILSDFGSAEYKGFSIIKFAYQTLRSSCKNDYFNIKTYKKEMSSRCSTILKQIKSVYKKKSRQYWTCGSSKYIEGKNFEQITRLIQGYIENEKDLNEYSRCSKTCEDYKVNNKNKCTNPNKCSMTKCHGKILNCMFIESDMKVCPAHYTSHKRYELVKYSGGTILGDHRYRCESHWKDVQSWWKFYHCSYCMCFCDEIGPKSDRYINLMDVKSDILSNKVITGLRFIKKNRIIHLQIQEGVILRKGIIDQSTVRWVPVKNYTIKDKHKVSGVDYHILHYNRRAVDLDDLYVTDGFVLTGVRFRLVHSHLKFEIGMTAYDFKTGILSPKIISWKKNPSIAQKELSLHYPDVPTKSYQSKIDTGPNQYIKFTHSDLYKDIAQTTVPFIDAQEVVPSQPVPLGGAGIYYKGEKGFGGFIAPKVITYDYTRYLDSLSCTFSKF